VQTASNIKKIVREDATVASTQRQNVAIGPLGVDEAALAELPQGLRGEVIDALVEARAAMQTADEKRQTDATARVTDVHARVQAWRAERGTRKYFATMTPVRGAHAIFDTLAKRG
jgi:hypothetical protein